MFKQGTINKLIFSVSLILSLSVTYQLATGRYQQDRMHAIDLATSYTQLVTEKINHILSATYPIAALIQNQQGDTSGFEELAHDMLPHYPGLSSLQLVRGGIIEYIIPIEGNEAAVGKDLFTDPYARVETLKVKESGSLTLTGPYNLYQGGTGVIGRMPIYLYNKNKQKTFWGFANTLIKFPDILTNLAFDPMEKDGYSYELSRINPETGIKQTMASSATPLKGKPVTIMVTIPGGKWHLSITPTKGWFAQALSTILFQVLLAISFSLFLTISLASLKQQQRHAKQLEKQVKERTKTLDEHLRRLQMSFSIAKQRSFDLNLKTNQISINNEYSRISGFDTHPMILSFEQYKANIHPDDLPHVSEAYQDCLSDGTTHDIEFREKGYGKLWTWVNLSGTVVEWDDQKKPTRIIGIYTDIHDRKKNEGALRTLAESKHQDDQDIFKVIARQIALSYDAQYTIISTTKNQQTAQTIAAWSSEPIPEHNEFDLSVTPYPTIKNETDSVRIYKNNVQSLFPKDPFLKQLNAKGYIGIKLVDNNNQPIGLISLFHTAPLPDYKDKNLDLIRSLAIRASNEIERRNFESRHILSARLFNQANEGIIITNPRGIIIDVNPTFCKITGYSKDEAIGQNPSLLNSGRQNSEFYQNLWKSLTNKGHWQGEVWNRKKNGELYAELLTISSLKDEQGTLLNYVGLFSDITQSKQQQEKLELIAHYDVLTKLPNRTLLSDRFSRAIKQAKKTRKQIAICFIDLDNFKPINDKYGHAQGDQVLITVASRIKNNIRVEDTLSRQGGDEFALLIQDVDSIAQLEHMLHRLIDDINKPYKIENDSYHVTASIGVTLYPQDDADLDTLMRHADHAMYQAKLAGKNQFYFFNTQHNKKALEIQSKRKEIEFALNHDQFQLYYQPKVNMRTGEVFGAEALIRWIHPEKGLIPPLDFLPLIDGTPLEIEVGNWVINSAVTQLDEWQENGLEPEISINISSAHLQSGNFIDTLEKIISKKEDIDARHLQLEILESSELSDLNSISEVILESQKRLGIEAALDDFGTGYSSLTHLRNLPASTIKIDQSFIRNMLDDPNDYAIVDGIIQLSNAFGREVIAEGVETTEHGLMLMLMGCDNAQGYCISKPLPANELLHWLKYDYAPNKQWLAFNKQVKSEGERKRLLLELSLRSGTNKFKNCIMSKPDSPALWPIMDEKNCHTAFWLEREKQEGNLDINWLNNLTKKLQHRHKLANEIKEQYQQNEVEMARQILPTFITLTQDIIDCLKAS